MRKVLLDICDVFEADRDANRAGVHTTSLLLLDRELLVRGRGGMNDQCPSIADVCKVRGELAVVDERLAELPFLLVVLALELHAEDGAEAALAEVLLGTLVAWVMRQGRVDDVLHARLLQKPGGELVRVLAVRLATKLEGLNALDQLEGVHRRLAAAKITQRLDAGEEDEERVRGADAKDGMLEELQVVVRGLLVSDLRELVVAVLVLDAPVEVLAVNDHAADDSAVPAEPLCGGLDDNVGAKAQGPAGVAAHAESVVDDERDLVLLGDSGDDVKVGHIVGRV